MMVFLPDGLLPGLPAVGSGPGGGAKAGAESGAPVALPGGRTGGGGVFGLPPLPGSITAALGPYVAGLGPGGAAGSGFLPDTKTGPGPGGIHVGVAGSFDMPLGVTTGDYQADAEGMPNLLAEVRKRTKVHVTIQERYVPLTLADLKNLPVVHVRGHRPFSFTPQEREVLRQYVAQGGTILGEDSHGPFGECFRREIRKIFGEAPRDLPLDHEIYRSHYVLGGIPAGDMGERYPIQGVPVGSRLGVIFSRNDYGDCWEGTGGWVKPESREPAFQIGTNIFVYIVAHWQKRQQR
jgi:hypothetical protein